MTRQRRGWCPAGARRGQGFLNTVVTTAPQVTSYLVEHAPQLRPDPFTGQLVAAALQVRAVPAGRGLAGPRPR